MEYRISEDFTASIDHIQEEFYQVYGKYDLQKSMIWMVEELGEVISAIRKEKSKEEYH